MTIRTRVVERTETLSFQPNRGDGTATDIHDAFGIKWKGVFGLTNDGSTGKV